jgi:hypothetical protein
LAVVVQAVDNQQQLQTRVEAVERAVTDHLQVLL